MDKTKGKGTTTYYPESVSWRDGSARWDIWALVVIICEADMPFQQYHSLQKQDVAMKAIRAHDRKQSTCANLHYLLENTLYQRNCELTLNLKDVREVIPKIRFQPYQTDYEETSDIDGGESSEMDEDSVGELGELEQ